MARPHLGSAAVSVRRQGAPPSLACVDKALLEFRHSLDGLRQSGTLRRLDTDEVERIFGLAFALQQLRSNLGDLADRLAEYTSPSSPGNRNAP